MILYRNSAAGFLSFSAIFFLLAWLVARWQGFRGWKAWGLGRNNSGRILLLIGLLIGLAAGALSQFASLAAGIEVISFVPAAPQFLSQASLFIFGCAVSSLTEDVLTRGYVVRHLQERAGPLLIVCISALVYVLNHIHRLNEPLYLLYLFILGIQLAIPLLFTRSIWYTFGVHWAGNMIYHISNNVMHTGGGSNPFPALGVGILAMLVLIPINYLICRELARPKAIHDLELFYPASSPVIRHSSRLI